MEGTNRYEFDITNSPGFGLSHRSLDSEIQSTKLHIPFGFRFPESKKEWAKNFDA